MTFPKKYYSPARGKKYFQVALGIIYNEKTLKRGFGNLQNIADNYPKTVVTMDTFSGNTFEGIEIIDLQNFLSKGL